MKDAEIQAEISAIIEETVGQGRAAPAGWLVQAVMVRHPGIEGADKDFYACCAQGHVAHLVRQVLRLEKANEDRDDAQLVLPGFKHLHRRYSVERDGEQVVVPVENLRDAEIHAKAAEYRRMARGCDEHADELLRYLGQRGGGLKDAAE